LTSIKIIFEDFIIDEQTYFVAYKLENFIAECGGLLGLFIGFSMLSIVELFYFCIKGILARKEDFLNARRIKKENKQFLRHNR
jgi:hypothetical protein